MGNQLAQPQRVHQDHLADIPDIVFKESIGGGRFLKTILCVHDKGGQVIVKVYNKRGEVDLEKYKQQLQHIRTRLSGLPSSHVWPFQLFFATDKAAYLIRQHIFSNLYHRLSTRPFLASLEKHWIAFQLLHAVAQSHEQGICHGDIKCENILVTSWHWILLADFASYKPAYLPADNPADFSFFFDTGGRRRCYIAPERLYTSDTPEADALSEAPLHPSMDIFSLGCVLAELFLEGQRLFDLSELLAYKRGAFDPSATLAKVEEPFRELIVHMINVNPDARLSASSYLQDWGPKLFPSYFDSLLHPFFCSVLPMDPDHRILAIEKEFPLLVKTILGPAAQTLLDSQPMPAHKQGLQLPQGEELEAHDHTPNALPDKNAVKGLISDSSDLLARLQKPKAKRSKAGPKADLKPSSSGKVEASSKAKTVVLEEAVEFECRDSGRGGFGEASTSGRIAAYKEWTPPKGSRREDVALPAESGWQWTDEWHVDRESPIDSWGWSYRTVSPSGDVTWTSKCKPECLWRRRRWTRQRRKLHTQPYATVQDGAFTDETGGNIQGLVIVATLLCSSMRGAKLQECKVKAISLLTDTAKYCDDDTRLQRIVPYLIECIKVPLASVRYAALQGLVTVLKLIETLPPSDAKVFAEYILPSLSRIPNDDEEWIRIAYAAAVGPLSSAAYGFLSSIQNSGNSSEALVKFETELQDVRGKVEKVVGELVVGPKSSTSINRALLAHADILAAFLGRRESNDFLLPILMTFLNSPDWQLRSSFFSSANSLAEFAGPAGIEAYLLPCLLQALGDQQDAVVAQALSFLAAVTDAGLLRRRSLLAIVNAKKGLKILPSMLSHTSAAVRSSAADFAAATARQLSKAEAYVFLQPKIFPALTRQPAEIKSAESLASCMPPHSTKASAYGQPPLILPKSRKQQQESSGSKEGRKQKFEIPEAAPLYSIRLDPKAQQANASSLTAALRTGKKSAQPPKNLMSNLLQPGKEQDLPQTGQALLGKARKITRATADMASVHGKLAPSLQLSSEEALSFQVNGWRGTSPPESSVNTAMDAAIHTSLPTHGVSSIGDSVAWRPKGILATHLVEHKKAVNRIAVAGNGSFFVTVSDDETAKVWDCRRLERDVSFRSRLTFAPKDGRILACTSCQDSQAVASATSGGTLHVWRVEYTSKAGGMPDRYTGIAGVQEAKPGEGAILELKQWGHLLVYTTQQGRIHGWDIRSPRDAWVLNAKPSQGCCERLALDNESTNWLVAGSSRGHLSVWDLRFQLCAKEWQLEQRSPVQGLALALASPRRLGLPRLGSTSPLIYVSNSTQEVSLWDIENARCHQVLRMPSQSDGSQAKPEETKQPQGQFGTDDLQQQASSSPQGSRALLPTAAGALLTGSSDACIRCWDASQVDNSYMVCGPPSPLNRGPREPKIARSSISYGQMLSGGMHCVEESVQYQAVTDKPSKLHERQAASSHADSILDMTALSSFGERTLLSASADGIVKAWK